MPSLTQALCHMPYGLRQTGHGVAGRRACDIAPAHAGWAGPTKPGLTFAKGVVPAAPGIAVLAEQPRNCSSLVNACYMQLLS